MGQYQQWLYCREVDQHLHAQLEALEAELSQLQDHANLLEQTCPHTDNQIIRALAASIGWEAPRTSTSHLESVLAMNSPDAHSTARQFPQMIPPSLQYWGSLLDISPLEMQEAFHNGEESSVPSTPHSEMVLLPEDLMGVYDEQAQTQPQLELPWWLHNIMVSTGSLERTNPIDQESIRTNRLVQRWLERWGRRPPTNQTSQEDQLDE
jgi:hypothetical protein